jgi:hypothetical protein
MNPGSAMAKASFVPVLALLLVIPNLRAQGLGGVSTCPSAPQITAAATSFALQGDTGLNSRQASAVVTTVVRQATQAAPYAMSEICTAAMQTVQATVLQTAAQGKTPQGDLSHEEVAQLSASEAVAVADGYRKMTKAVVQGAIDGGVSAGIDAPELQKLIASVTTSMVKDAGLQAALTATTSKDGTPDPSKGLPMDTAEEGKTVTAMIVATIAQVAKNAGFSDKEISTAVNRAAAECVNVAQNIDSVIRQGVASEVAGQVAGQVANQVASQVAVEVAKQVATAVAAEVVKPTSQLSVPDGGEGRDDAPTQNQNNAPKTLPTAPGQTINPGVNTPPTVLTPPTPASSGGTR